VAATNDKKHINWKFKTDYFTLQLSTERHYIGLQKMPKADNPPRSAMEVPWEQLASESSRTPASCHSLFSVDAISAHM